MVSISALRRQNDWEWTYSNGRQPISQLPVEVKSCNPISSLNVSHRLRRAAYYSGLSSWPNNHTPWYSPDNDVFIELLGLPSRGMLCGYKNELSAIVISLSGIIYLMYNWLYSKVTSGSFAPVFPKLKNKFATHLSQFKCTHCISFLLW